AGFQRGSRGWSFVDAFRRRSMLGDRLAGLAHRGRLDLVRRGDGLVVGRFGRGHLIASLLRPVAAAAPLAPAPPLLRAVRLFVVPRALPVTGSRPGVLLASLIVLIVGDLGLSFRCLACLEIMLGVIAVAAAAPAPPAAPLAIAIVVIVVTVAVLRDPIGRL